MKASIGKYDMANGKRSLKTPACHTFLGKRVLSLIRAQGYLIKLKKFDLVITDIDMPIMSGLHLPAAISLP